MGGDLRVQPDVLRLRLLAALTLAAAQLAARRSLRAAPPP